MARIKRRRKPVQTCGKAHALTLTYRQQHTRRSNYTQLCAYVYTHVPIKHMHMQTSAPRIQMLAHHSTHIHTKLHTQKKVTHTYTEISYISHTHTNIHVKGLFFTLRKVIKNSVFLFLFSDFISRSCDCVWKSAHASFSAERHKTRKNNESMFILYSANGNLYLSEQSKEKKSFFINNQKENSVLVATFIRSFDYHPMLSFIGKSNGPSVEQFRKG